MSSLRSLLLLAIVGGLALFVIQNWTPVLPLVIFGMPTQAIPLAFWMMGAIAAGAMTTIAISALFRITAFTAAPRPSKRKGRSSSPPPNPDRGLDPRDVPYGVSESPRTRIQSDDDWEPQPREVWDDWDAPAVSSSRSEREDQRYRSVEDRSIEDRPAVDFRMGDREVDRVERIEYRFTNEERSEERQNNLPDEEPEFYREPDAVPNFGNVEPPVYDADYKVYRPAYRPLEEPYEPPYTEPVYSEPPYSEPDYQEPEYRESPYSEPDYRNEYPQPPYTEPEREVWDDWEDEPELEPETPIAPPEPQRPIVEVQQTPKSQYRSGTVYSYSYRGEDEPKIDRVDEKTIDEKPTEEPKRVIIPPAPADDEDWGFDADDDEDGTDASRRSNRDDW